MARTISTIVLIVLLNVLVGCGSDTGTSQLMPARTTTSLGAAASASVGQAGEADLIENVATNRRAYRQGLESLVEYYTKTGNNMKLQWAEKELAALNTMPQYDYLIEGIFAGPDLRATESKPEADQMYQDAVQLQRKAGPLPFLKNANLLRLALDRYNQLIRSHPTSDKIDDAAFKAGGIYEYFKDYSIAVEYYERAYQWDPETIHPARFRAAMVLDKYLRRRAEALELYRQAVKEKNLARSYKAFAEKRIKELTKSETLEK